MDDSIIIGAIVGGFIGLIVAIIMIAIMKKRGGKVPRFSQFVSFNGDTLQIMPRLEQNLAAKGYKPQSYNGEDGIYQRGTGALVAKQFIKLLPQEGGILVEGFIRLYGTESGLSGFTGTIPKKACKKVIDNLITQIENASRNSGGL